jgi:lipoprotein-releasing system ATP-binding protein
MQNKQTDLPIIQAKGLVKRFVTGESTLTVLREVDFSVMAGSRVGIRGESGCGKSTLLNVLSRLEEHDEGELFWQGEAIDSISRTRLARRRGELIGFVFQAYYLVPELNALENVLLPTRILGTYDRAARDRGKDLLQRVGLSARVLHAVTKLSGGERQRVAVARALIHRPPVVFADEPTGNLDERSGSAVMDLIERLSREEESALVLVTHNADFAARMDFTLTLTMGKFDQ